MRTALHIVASLVASLAAFAAVSLATIVVGMGLYGDTPFEQDASTEAALGVLILVIALPVAIATFLFVVALLHNRQKRAGRAA